MKFGETKDRKAFEIPDGARIHLVGIGGSGLSAIAWVLLGRGYRVSGSDQQPNEVVADLSKAGAVVFRGHSAKNVYGADMVLISSAIGDDNSEILAAKAAGTPIVKRDAFLGALLADAFTIAVAGTHGKTTTAGMIVQILLQAERDPSAIVGGVLPALGRNGRAGEGETFVVEADEYDRMFLGLHPNAAVVTNVEYDHPDLFESRQEYQDAFRQFVDRIEKGGSLVVCADDPGAMELVTQMGTGDISVATYGLAVGEWQATDLRPNQLGGTDFLVLRKQETVGLMRLRVPGEHNVRNALAATAVTSALEVDFHEVVKALATFGGIERRFEVVGEIGDVTVIDDYAHHPTEIRATLAAARQRYTGRRLWAVWQPHTFSRTTALLDEFASCFEDADRVVALDIYRSREKQRNEMTTANVLEMMDHPNAAHIAGLEEAASYLLERVRPGDVVVTLTAGDGNLVGKWVLEGLEERAVQNQPAPL